MRGHCKGVPTARELAGVCLPILMRDRNVLEMSSMVRGGARLDADPEIDQAALSDYAIYTRAIQMC
ncbi:MAG: hypothetical protein ACP5EP_13175, partial [Acidobacteriaceae bacterium]